LPGASKNPTARGAGSSLTLREKPRFLSAMKLPLLSILSLLLLAACSSAPTTSRTDYADPSFGGFVSRRAAREAEIRRSFPNLSPQQVEEKLALEFPSGAPRK